MSPLKYATVHNCKMLTVVLLVLNERYTSKKLLKEYMSKRILYIDMSKRILYIDMSKRDNTIIKFMRMIPDYPCR